MENNYLYKINDKWKWFDGVFMGTATVSQDRVSKYCLEQADNMRNSILENYDNLTTEQRERLAKLWEAAINLPDGKYEYYFNLDNKKKECKFTEDYCSQEVVKLLKDKISSPDLRYIWEDNKVTHQMAMKILRDLYDIHIIIGYSFMVNKIDDKLYLAIVSTKEHHTSYDSWSEFHSTYEEAVEAALKYALKNLIGSGSKDYDEDYDEKIIKYKDKINQLEKIKKD